MGNNDRRTAVIAGISHGAVRSIERILEKNGISAIRVVENGALALKATVADAPDIVVCDAVMPYLDGIAFARRLAYARLPVRPGVVICRWPEMRVEEIPYFAAAVDKPASEVDVIRAIAEVSVGKRSMPAGKRRAAEKVLDDMGLHGGMGRECLILAAFMASEDTRLMARFTGRLIPMVAMRTGISAAAAERAMRHSIEQAWRTGNIERQYEFFRGTIDAARGKPTCGEMTARLAEALRMEVFI